MNEEQRAVLNAIVDALEAIWLQNLAMGHLLDGCKVPGWYDLMTEYCERETSKSRARERFAPCRALIQAAKLDSEALEALLPMIQGKGKPH